MLTYTDEEYYTEPCLGLLDPSVPPPQSLRSRNVG